MLMLLYKFLLVEAVPGHMPADKISQQRVSQVLDAMQKLAKLK